MTPSSSCATSPTPREHAPGDVIATKYLLGHVLGSGGMGTVWAATNLDIGLKVAVKVVNPGGDREEIAARLALEARTEARLQHPGIIRVIDLGITEQGEPFLVMERLEGESLASLLERVGRIDARAAVRLMLPVIDALGFAHSRNVVHRDLKPDNIFLSLQAGRVQPKIVDFGIAKLGEGTVYRRRTGSGTVVGSPGYMAPEHARGKEVDHRADIFTACVVLYECITGTAAFEAENYNALIQAVIEQELPPITWFGSGDATLSAILDQGLRKDPAKRFASCDELGRALAAWLAATGETEDVSGTPLHGPWLAKSLHTSRSENAPSDSSAALPAQRVSTPGSGHSVSFPTSPALKPRRRWGQAAFAAVLGGFLLGFGLTTSVDGLWRNWIPTSTSPRSAVANVVSAAGAGPQTIARDTEPVVRPVEPRPLRLETPRAARAGAPSPVVPRRRTAKNGADTTPYPIPRAPALALPSEPALMSFANADTTRTDLKEPY